MSTLPVPPIIVTPSRADAASLGRDGTVGAGYLAGTARAGRRRLALVFAAGDAVGLGAAATVLALAGPWHATAHAPLGRVAAGFLAAVAVLAVLAIKGLYRISAGRIAPRVADDVGAILAALATAGAVLFALDGIGTLRGWVPPAEVGGLLVLAAVAIPAVRELALAIAARHPANVQRVVIVGGGFVASYLTARLSRSRLVDVLGIVDDTAFAGRRRLGSMAELPRICAAHEVDRIVVAFSGRHPAKSASVLQAVRGLVEIDVVVRYFELASWESRVSDVTGLALLNIGREPGRASRAVKRLVDVAVATVLLVALSPLLAVTALAVRLESGAPVLFRQVRVGRGRRQFEILKFRSMRSAPGAHPAAPADPVAPMDMARAYRDADTSDPDDPGRTPLDTEPDITRVTRTGALLRRTGIDELPQLLNVLRGDMSLVGPRPFIPEECASLQGTVERRFDVRPGMTGLWQVCGQHEVGFDELCRLDVQYATSWSIRGDLRVLARTPGRLVRGSR